MILEVAIRSNDWTVRRNGKEIALGGCLKMRLHVVAVPPVREV